MKQLSFLTLTTLCFTLLLCSCGDDSANKCEGEEKVTGFNTMDTTEFYRLLATPDLLPHASYRTAYFENANNLGISAFVLQTSIIGACSYEPIFVNSRLELLIADADVKDTLSVESSSNYFKQSVLPSGTLYAANEYFDPKGTGDVDVLIKHVVWFPYKGSSSADSLYFWSNMVNWRLGSLFVLRQ